MPGSGFHPAPCSHGPYLGCVQSELGLGAGAVVGPSGEVGPFQLGRAHFPQVMPELATGTSKTLLILSNILKLCYFNHHTTAFLSRGYFFVSVCGSNSACCVCVLASLVVSL